MTDIWQNLLEQARTMHADHPDIRAFCDFPDDLKRQQMLPHSIPASDLMVYDTGLVSETPYCGFRDGFIACAPQARWRQTYKGTNIGNDFLDRFGCYELIGQEGVFHSTQMRSFVVYAPAGLHYPWHHHPAEELYLVLAGEAEFRINGENGKTLRPGETAYHASMKPHAMTTHDHPVMAYVLWRGNLTVAPVLTSPE